MRGILVLIFFNCLLPNVFGAGESGDPFLEGHALYDAGEPKKAMPLLVESCDSGNARGCYYVGMIYSYNDDNTEAAYEKAFQFLTKSCDLADVGCDELNRLYYFGKIINKEATAKATKYDAACVAGDSEACLRLGIMYADGDKIKHDETKSVKLYERACELKNGEGCLYLGAPMLNMFLDGEPYDIEDYEPPVDKMDTEAVCEKGLAALQKSCDVGFGKSCSLLGYVYMFHHIYYNLSCVKPNNITAVDYFIKGCELKYKNACNILKRITKMENRG